MGKNLFQSVLRLLIVAVYIACFWRRASGFPVADEVDFMKPLEAWVQGSPRVEGLWHAPFYPWILSLLGKIFGYSPFVARSVGALTTAATAACMVWAGRMFRFEEWKITLALALGLLSPIALGSALILDYDTTLLVASTALYFAVLVKASQQSRLDFKQTTQFGLVLGLCLMAKETTPLVYPVGIFFLYFTREGVAKALAASIVALLIGVMVFCVPTAIWCAYYKLPFASVFAMDLLGLKIHGGTAGEWARLSPIASAWVKFLPFFWIGIPLFIFALFNIRKISRVDSVLRAIFAVIVFVKLAYTFGLSQRTYQFPKYMAPVLGWTPWLLLAIEKPRAKFFARKTEWLWLFPCLVFLFDRLPGYFGIDPLHVLYGRDFSSLVKSQAVFAAAFVLWLLVRKPFPKHIPQFSTLVWCLTISLCANYARVALVSEKSITYWYGEHSVREARDMVEIWRKVTPQGKILIPSKDLAWATREFGSEYYQKDEMNQHYRELCAEAKSGSMLIVTRIREDSSFIHSPALEPLRQCLKTSAHTMDIVAASSYR